MQGIIKIDKDHPLYSILMEALQDQPLDNDSTSQPDDLDFLNRLLADAGMLNIEDDIDLHNEVTEDFPPDKPDSVGMTINDKDYYVHPDVAELFTDMSSTIENLRRHLHKDEENAEVYIPFIEGPVTPKRNNIGMCRYSLPETVVAHIKYMQELCHENRSKHEK